MVGEQLAAHLLDSSARLVLARAVQLHLDVLADPNVGYLAEAKRGQALPHRDALGIVDHRLWSDDEDRDHVASTRGVAPIVRHNRLCRRRGSRIVRTIRGGVIARPSTWVETAVCRRCADTRSGSATVFAPQRPRAGAAGPTPCPT